MSMQDDHESASEHSHLLAPSDRSHADHEAHLLPQLKSPSYVVVVLSLVIFMIMFGAFMCVAPSLRIYEDIICHHYYDNVRGEGHVSLAADIDEKLCKGDAIQEELAIVVGGMNLCDSLPGLLFAFPYGILADRIGRKPVFGMAMGGSILGQIWIMAVCWFWRTFPLRLIWLSPIFQIMGGGGAVLRTMIFAIVSDISPEAARANYFFFLGCGTMGAEFVAPSLASALMRRSPWIPVFAGLAIMISGGICMVLVPETLHHMARSENSKPAAIASDSSSSISSIFLTPPSKLSWISKLRANFNGSLQSLRTTVSVPLMLLLATSFTNLLGRATIDFVLRYISKRFNWSLANTSFLLSLRALINVILFLAILPGISYILTSSKNSPHSIPGLRFNLSTMSKDLILAQTSFIIQILGTALLGFSAFPSPNGGVDQETALPITLAVSGLIVYTLGIGFTNFARSLITTLVDQQHVARLYSIISVVETMGAFITAPGIAWLYSQGLRLASRGGNKGFLGLPFLGITVFTFVAGCGVMFVKASGRTISQEGVEEETFEENQ